MRPAEIGQLGSGHLTGCAEKETEAECSTGAALRLTSHPESKATGSSRDLPRVRRLLRKPLGLDDFFFFTTFFSAVFFCSLAGVELGKEQRWRSKCIDVLISR